MTYTSMLLTRTRRLLSAMLLRVTLTLLFFVSTGVAADQLTESFTGSRYNHLALGSVGESKSLIPGEDGLKIQISPPDTGNAGVQLPRQLIGDFVMTANVALIEVPTPKSGFGTGVAVLLEDGEKYGASIQRVVMPDGRQVYIAHHYVVTNGAYDHQAEIINTTAKSMKLQIERKGSELFYRVSEDGEQTFHDLHHTGFTSNPIRVTQIYGQTGGELNSLTVLLKELTVEAAELLRPGQRSRTQDRGKLVVIATISAAVILTMGLVIRRTRRQRGSMSE